jgi:iron complex transport system ATP-binding protein
MASSSYLEVRNLSLSYGSRQALSSVSFEMNVGESLALVGPNGSGKSTLIKALSRVLDILDGSVHIGNLSLSKLMAMEVARLVAVVPQEEFFPFRFSAREVVAMGRLAKSSALFDSEEDRAETVRSMKFCDCLQFAERPITELSGGERQRVLIARAINQGTPILLLDEPTTHLDVLHQVRLFELIAKLSSEGKTIITSSHDLNNLDRIAKRAILLNEGRAVLDASIPEMIDSPELDRVYGVQFERIRSGEGSVLVPRSLIS